MPTQDKSNAVFFEEAAELLVDLENALLELEERPDDRELIARIFRAMHTIKGSGSMFGFDKVAKFTHEIESVFDLVRNDKMVVSKELINLTLAGRDQIKTMLGLPEQVTSALAQKNAEIIANLRTLIPGAAAIMASTEKAPPADQRRTDDADPAETYRIFFKPSRDIFSSGADPLLLLRELQALGKCTIIASTDALPLLDEIDPETCYTEWNIVLTTDRGLNAVRDVFLFVEDDSVLTIDRAAILDSISSSMEPPPPRKLGDILVERGDIAKEVIAATLEEQKGHRIGQLLVDKGLVASSKVAVALAEQEHTREVQEKKQREEAAMSVRVPADKLDRLVDLVGELVTVQARFSQAAGRVRDNADILSISEEVERLTAELRDNAMSIRMLPIGTTFSRFKRLVRDLSAELGKEIELSTSGAETELDKTVIEKLGDPLVHLIRNSIDHGIESPEARAKAGKSKQGRIHLAATHAGAYVHITISDDGAGIDCEAVRLKAVERGLIPEDARMPEREIYALLFEPGFSMAKSVTNISGRGVGMDVVKKTIDGLRGTVEIASCRGQGTTMTLQLPLTLAIIDGFLTKVAAEHFVFPLSIVEECVELGAAERRAANGRHIINVRGQLVPYMRLREQFSITGVLPDVEQIVITRINNLRMGFVVDSIIGGHQTVLKNLGKYYQAVEGISGATILGDGTVALVLDAPKLISQLEQSGVKALNCWEFKKCGREPGGAHAKEFGVCPVYPNHGRRCAQVAGTFCGGEIQGSFATKIHNCSRCDFYQSEHYSR